jgi:ubiquinone/menaquinone biosynthesis C-methylase UbiE
MTESIQFNDGAAYERFMGKWSALAGVTFLDWLAPQAGLRWLDVGCGNGAFTELLIDRCNPSSVVGVDPSEGQLAHARQRFPSGTVEFHQGDAMALPFADAGFDTAVMPLVIFFVPQPELGVAEMARVVRPGGVVAAYAWDMAGGGFPYAVLLKEMRARDLFVPEPPSADASRLDRLRELWAGARLEQVETRSIAVERTFADFNDYWETVLGSPSAGKTLAGLSPAALQDLKSAIRDQLTSDASGRIICSATANAVRGIKHAD